MVGVEPMLTVGTAIPASPSRDACADHQVALVARDLANLVPRRRVVGVAGVRQDAGETHVPGLGKPARNLDGSRGLGLDAAAVISAVDLHVDVERNAGASGRGVERHRDLDVVGQDAQALDTARERQSAVEFSGLDRDGIGDVGEAGIGERLGLGKRRDRDRAVEASGLDARNLDAFVRLDVRPEARAHAGDALGHPLGVASHAGGVEDERRRLDRVKLHGAFAAHADVAGCARADLSCRR